jgi:hypothetical protein
LLEGAKKRSPTPFAFPAAAPSPSRQLDKDGCYLARERALQPDHPPKEKRKKPGSEDESSIRKPEPGGVKKFDSVCLELRFHKNNISVGVLATSKYQLIDFN